jgi:hypothetical protein
MRPCQNCGRSYHILRGRMECLIKHEIWYHFYYTTMMNVLILQVGWNQREVLFGEWIKITIMFLTPCCHVYSLMKHTWMLKWQVCQPNVDYVAWAYGCIWPTSRMTMCRASLKWQPLQYQCVLWLCFWPTSFIIMFRILVSSFPSSAQRCCGLEPKFMLERFWRHVLQVKVIIGNLEPMNTNLEEISPIDFCLYASGRLRIMQFLMQHLVLSLKSFPMINNVCEHLS